MTNHSDKVRTITRLGTVAALATGLCFAPVARGETVSKEDCISAHVAAQQHKNESQLLAAKKQLIICAQGSCPAAIRSECGTLLEEVETGMPSIVITAEDGAGHDISDVRVTLDGQPLVETLDGKPIAFDPGAHQLRFERQGSPPIEQEIIVQAGVKYRAVKIRFEADGEPGVAGATGSPTEQPDSTPADSSGVSPLVYVGFAVAGVGAIVGGITGGISLSQASDLQDDCPENACAMDRGEDIDSMMALGHVSTASFIIAGVGAGVGLVALIVGGSDASETGSIRPLVGPGFLGMKGSF
ncbi:MAG: hypothetical protein DRI90_15970 [Deltaproteobacteria bacterium]|nr:MAG: hypothetical protein DRI90_15970 [Deltaproteobacteria bacterium]